jgi:predicted RNase H-like nuclease (RuvC/YqgF family)
VIEFVLLFGLGFLAAALVALIVAPVIQRRVVTLTERRIRASVPLSAAEIRAEKDMARAAYAADNARLSTDLKQHREALTEATAHGMRLSNELVAIRAEKLAAEQSLEERDASIRELNAKIHKSDGEIANLTGNLAAAIRLAEVRKQEIAAKEDKINHLGAEIEELRIDIATLDTEAENFKAQISEPGRRPVSPPRPQPAKTRTQARPLQTRPPRKPPAQHRNPQRLKPQRPNLPRQMPHPGRAPRSTRLSATSPMEPPPAPHRRRQDSRRPRPPSKPKNSPTMIRWTGSGPARQP